MPDRSSPSSTVAAPVRRSSIFRSPRRADARRNSWAKTRVAEWNAAHPEPPYTVRYWRGVRPADDSGAEVGVVYTRAHLLAGITPVVFVRGAGAIALTHVERQP